MTKKCAEGAKLDTVSLVRPECVDIAGELIGSAASKAFLDRRLAVGGRA